MLTSFANKENHNSKGNLWILYLSVASLILIGYLFNHLSTTRHISTLLILMFVGFGNQRVSIKKAKFLLGLSSILLYSIIVSLDSPSLYTLKSAALILSPLLGVLFLTSSKKLNSKDFINVFFYVAVSFQIIALVTSKTNIASLGVIQLLSASDTSRILLTTESEIESSLGMIFGYLSLYFLTSKRYKHLAVCLALFLLNYKRIVLLGFMVSTCFHLISLMTFSSRIPFRRIIYAIPFLALVLLVEMGSGNLNDLSLDLTGRTMNQLTTGRYAIHHQLFIDLFKSPEILFGYGIGHTHQMVSSYGFTRMALAHSDYLMLMYDIGIFCFVIFFVLFFKTFLTSKRNAVYIIFFLTLLFFDNTIIYFDAMFILYLILIDSQQAQITSLEQNSVAQTRGEFQ